MPNLPTPSVTPGTRALENEGAARQVTVILILAFLMFAIDHHLLTEEKDRLGTEGTGDFAKRYLAWAVLFVVLVAGADFTTTSVLAVSFAWLILLYMVLNSGPTVFARVQEMVTEVEREPST